MLRFAFTAFILLMSLPVMAEQSLSPTEIEQIPFDHSLANTPNTEVLMNDMEAAAGEVEHAEHAEKKAGLPQFDVTTFSSQLFWLLIMFVILYVFFAKKALPTLSKTIEDRRNTIRTDLEMADKLSMDVDQTRQEYETAMQNAQNDARIEITNAETEMRAEAEKQANEFKDHSAAEVDKVEKRAMDAKNEVMKDLENSIHELTAQIVKQVSGIEAKDAEVQKSVASILNTYETEIQKKAA